MLDTVARGSRGAAGGGSDDRSRLRRWIEDGPHGLLALGVASFLESTLVPIPLEAILLVGVTPIPFQAATLGAGGAGYPIPLFVLATLVARGIRYYGLALLVRLLGDRAQTVWERHATRIGVGILLLAALGVALSFV